MGKENTPVSKSHSSRNRWPSQFLETENIGSEEPDSDLKDIRNASLPKRHLTPQDRRSIESITKSLEKTSTNVEVETVPGFSTAHKFNGTSKEAM